MGNAPITAIIHTKNEGKNIARAIRSVTPLCSRVLIVDMASTDETIVTAQSLGADVLRVPDFGYMEPARRLALDAVETDWVLICDADEVIPGSLCEILADTAKDTNIDGAVLHARTFMFGAELTGSGYSRNREHHLKFYRVGSVRNYDEVHRRPEPVEGARIIDLGTTDRACYLHFNYLSWSHYLTKFDRYTKAESTKPISARSMVARAAKDVLVGLVQERAYRDGVRGIAIVTMMVAYRAVSLARAGAGGEDDEAVRSRYNDIAARVTASDLVGR